MTTNIREFKGYKVSEDFVIEVKSRGEDAVSLNLQELMAARLAGHPWTTSDKSFQGTTGMEELGVTTNPYGKMKSMRTSDKWDPAKEHFTGLNNLSEDKVKLLSGFTSQSSNGANTSVDKKLTKGDSQLIGLKIAQALSQEQTDFVVNNGIQSEVIGSCITSFVNSVRMLMVSSNRKQKERDARERALELKARKEALRTEAIQTFSDLGITEPTEDQITVMITKLSEKDA